MPLCRDPLVASLKAQGFSTLRVPRKDYLPGTVLFQARKGSLEVFGGIDLAFENVAPLELTESSQAHAFTTATTGLYRRSAALKLASDWLGVPQAGLAAGLGGTSKVTFRFGAMRILTCELGVVAAVLPDAEPSAGLLALPESRLFIVHEVLQAREISWLNETEADMSASAGMTETLANVAQLGFEIDTQKASRGLLVFSSGEFHTIGFKAYEVELAAGEFHLVRSLETAGISHMAEPERPFEPVVFDEMLF